MREIKFRAWDTKTKRFLDPWPEGFVLFGETTCFDLIGQQLGGDTLARMNDVEVMQYTGLKDKAGREIYEGDILGREENDGPYSESYIDTCEVKWHHSAWYVDFWGNENLLIDDYDPSTGEVIGNIYETPEYVR